MDYEDLLDAIIRVEMLGALILGAAQESRGDLLAWLKDRSKDHIAELKELRYQALLCVVRLDGSNPIDAIERDDLGRLVLRADDATYSVLGNTPPPMTPASP
jgi:hypothetical protein